jgi:hypothetical protein
MLFIFIAGALGFFVFDIYRMYSDRIKDGHLLVTFPHIKGLSAHLFIYAAAGVLGLMTNIDILYSETVTFIGSRNELGELAGPILRSFSLGILGPAALKKAKEDTTGMRPPSDGLSIDDTPVSKASFADYLRYFLMR